MTCKTLFILSKHHIQFRGVANLFIDDSSVRLLPQFFEAAERAGFRIYHKEPNSWGCGGDRCIEYAFVSKEHARLEHDMTHCAASSRTNQGLRGVSWAVRSEEETAAETKRVYDGIAAILTHQEGGRKPRPH